MFDLSMLIWNSNNSGGWRTRFDVFPAQLWNRCRKLLDVAGVDDQWDQAPLEAAMFVVWARRPLDTSTI